MQDSECLGWYCRRCEPHAQSSWFTLLPVYSLPKLWYGATAVKVISLSQTYPQSPNVTEKKFQLEERQEVVRWLKNVGRSQPFLLPQLFVFQFFHFSRTHRTLDLGPRTVPVNRVQRFLGGGLNFSWSIEGDSWHYMINVAYCSRTITCIMTAQLLRDHTRVRGRLGIPTSGIPIISLFWGMQRHLVDKT